MSKAGKAAARYGIYRQAFSPNADVRRWALVWQCEDYNEALRIAADMRQQGLGPHKVLRIN